MKRFLNIGVAGCFIACALFLTSCSFISKNASVSFGFGEESALKIQNLARSETGTYDGNYIVKVAVEFGGGRIISEFIVKGDELRTRTFAVDGLPLETELLINVQISYEDKLLYYSEMEIVKLTVPVTELDIYLKQYENTPEPEPEPEPESFGVITVSLEKIEGDDPNLALTLLDNKLIAPPAYAAYQWIVDGETLSAGADGWVILPQTPWIAGGENNSEAANIIGTDDLSPGKHNITLAVIDENGKTSSAKFIFIKE